MSPKGGAPPGPSTPTPVVRIGFADRRREVGERAVATEVAVAVSFAAVPFAVMMTTPADLEDFAYGFALTEGVIDVAADIRRIEIAPGRGGVALRIDLAPAKLQAHFARQRAMTGRTGCGVCGIADLDALPRAAAPRGLAPTVALGAIERALRDLEALQVLNAATRAVHAAAWADATGKVGAVREDVGRHNALDKLVGAALRAGREPDDGFVLVTSRASFEMVEKAAAFGARTLVAVSAPTSLAIARAMALDVTLVGIARRDGISVFHGAERVVG